MSKVIAAVVQARPIRDNLSGSVERAVEWIGQAASQGAGVVALGETWLPGYPAWLDCSPGACLWDSPAAKAAFARMAENSVVVPGPETTRLAAAAKSAGITVVIGVQERIPSGPGNRTLYNSLLIFSAEGELINHHRKLMPTYTERLVWGAGDAAGLRAVDTPFGRVGGLICWEHWMPLARQALHESGEDVHVAVWPTVKENCLLASQHYAFEGRCFVLAAGLLIHVDDLPEGLAAGDDSPEDGWVVRGGSAIIGPDGTVLAGPVGTEETVLIAELDLARIREESMTLDVSGHYARPDVLEFNVRRDTRRS
jgi:predicted amidohydrolase